MRLSVLSHLLGAAVLGLLVSRAQPLVAQTLDPFTQQVLAGQQPTPGSTPNGAANGTVATDSQEAVPAPVLPPPARASANGELPAFGANLFLGNFLRARPDGINDAYIVKPGDRVNVNTWGAVSLNGVFTVDGQGNLFLPDIGPIPVGGVRNGELTEVVRRHVGRVYLRHFGVYTNLLTARPISIFVTGAVQRPGAYPGLPSDSVLFYLDQAGGIQPTLGSFRNMQVLRDGKPILTLDLYDFVLHGRLEKVQLQEGDTILVGHRGPTVALTGHVATPARVELKNGAASGGEVLAVIPKDARANEVTWRGVRAGRPFQRTLPIAAFQHVQLQDGDEVQMRNEGHSETILIQLEGAFEGPAVRTVRRGTRLIDLLNHVELTPQLGDAGAIHLRRMSVAKAQKDAIEDSLFRLERSALLALSSSNGEADIRVKEAELMQRFTARARLIDPLGRVVTSHDGQQQNLLLEDGDTIVIPQKTGVVRVSGEIQIAHASAHHTGLTAADYIEAAGGYTDRADQAIVLLMHPNAEVEMVDPDHEVAPGDEILVPPRVDSKTLQNAMDITQVLYQVAVAAGVVLGVTL